MKTRAAVLHALDKPAPFADSKPLVIEEIELDAPGDGEVLVKMTAAGLCHSDLSVITGVRPRPVPMALGHEASAAVVQVGPGVHDLKPGDRVVLVFVPSCGHCLPCMEGRPALCEPGADANGKGTLLSGERRLHLHWDAELDGAFRRRLERALADESGARQQPADQQADGGADRRGDAGQCTPGVGSQT